MAERKQGPVKPPTIDLTAREAGPDEGNTPRRVSGRKPTEPADADTAVEAGDSPFATVEAIEPQAIASDGDVTAADADGLPPPQPIPPVPPTPPETPWTPERATVAGSTPASSPATTPWGMLVTAVVVGALLGTALTYVLASMVPLPAPAVPNLAPELSAQADRLTTIEDRLAATETGTLDVRTAVDATASEVVARLATLEAGLEELRQSTPAPVDVAAIEARLRTLTGRVDAIAAGASSADAGAMADNIGDLEAAVAALQTEVAAIKTATGDGGALATLETEVAALRAEMDAAAAVPEPPPVTALEAAIPMLDTAFASGQPFAEGLQLLADQQPPVLIDEALSARAARGLMRPDILTQRVAAAVPAMLAAKPATSGDWQQATGDWLASLLAIRPAAGEARGNTPDAVVSRLEAAIERGDYIAANAQMALLPPEMVTAAGNLQSEIATHAAAAQLLAELRAKVTMP